MPTITEFTPVAFSDPLPEAVDIVIIGAGIVGTSTAYFLAQRGAKVLLCEKGRVAGEQSSRNWGWIRQQGRDGAELPIMMEANRIWRELAARTGERDLGFTSSGCVYLAETEVQMAKYESWYELAKEHQLDTKMLSKHEASALVPDVCGSWIGGMLTESDGRAEPFVAVPALARAARKSGTVVIENCAVRTIETQAGRVTGAVTEKGRVKTACVLLAGGAWSTHFVSNLGLDLPQLMVRSTAGRTHPLPEEEVRRRLKRRLSRRAPWLEDVRIEELWAGMIDVTPDAVPYICEAPATGGLFIGTGMSGHGFGIGPGVGRILADLIQGRPPRHALSRFRFERFSDGSPIVPGPY